MTFSSPLLRQKMDGLGRAFPYLASEGTELADWSLSLSSSLEQVFASALREVAVQQAENLLERTLLERYGIAQVSAMNPGSLKVWSLEEQVPLFELLAPLPEKLGVTLLPSLMMRPEYSVSGVFFQTDSKSALPQKRVPQPQDSLFGHLRVGQAMLLKRIGGPCRD